MFTRIWRDGPLAKIEAHDSSRTAVVAIDLREPNPPVDTVTEVLEALSGE